MKPIYISKKLGIGVGIAAVVAMLLVACGGGTPDTQNTLSAEMKMQAAASTNKGPAISWNPTSITDTANPGSRQSFPVTFTSSANLANVEINVVPELIGIVKVTPTSFASIQAGQTATVTVSVAPSSAEKLRVVDGTIHVVVGTSTVAKPLPMTLTLVAPEVISGVTVPPEPPTALNNATLAGFDANSNGIRDDVERVIAKQFGLDAQMYSIALNSAKTLQSALMNPSTAPIQENIDASRCIADIAILTNLNAIEVAVINTFIRKRAYAAAFAGVVISTKGC